MGIFRDVMNTITAAAEKRKKEKEAAEIQAQQQAAANAAAEAVYRASPEYSSVLDKNFAGGASKTYQQVAADKAKAQQEAIASAAKTSAAYKTTPEYTQYASVLNPNYNNVADVSRSVQQIEKEKKEKQAYNASPLYSSVLDAEFAKGVKSFQPLATEGKTHKNSIDNLYLLNQSVPIEEAIAGERQQRQQKNIELAEYTAEKAPLIADWTSVVANLANSMLGVESVAGFLGSGKVNTDAEYRDAAAWRDTAREKRTEQIENNLGGGFLGDVGGFLYNVGMSAADSAVNTAVMGSASIITAGLGSAADTMDEYKKNGYSDARAGTLGIIAGIAEGATEKIGLDELFNTNLLNTNVKKYIIRNALAEGAEEGATAWINFCYDTVADIVMGERKGDLLAGIDHYKAQGYSNEQALGKSVADVAAQMGLDVLGGMISGGAMSSPGAVANALSQKAVGRNVYSEALEDIRAKNPETERGAVNTQMVNIYADRTLGKAGVTAFNQMYEGVEEKVDAADYIREMTKYYNAAINGQDISSVEIKEVDGITPQMREAAYVAGQSDAENVGKTKAAKAETEQQTETNETTATEENVENELFTAVTEQKPKTAKTIEFAEEAEYNNNIAESEVISNEEQSSDTEVGLRDSGKRNDGTYSGTESGSVAERAGQTESRRQAVSRTAKDGETAALTLGEEVSVASLGIGKGSVNHKLRVVTGGDTKHTREARRIAKENGIQLVMVDRDMIIDGKSVRGYISGGRMFVNVNHPDFTADQIARHEAAHDKIVKGKIDVAAVKERVAAEHDVKAVSKMYAGMYAGSGMTADQAFIEMICDAEGDMNIFEGRLDSKSKQYAEVLKTVKQEAKESESRAKAKEFAEEYGADEAFSINYDEKNIPYVVIETDILKNVPKKQWIKAVKKNLAKKFPDGVKVGKNIIKLNSTSRREMTFSKYTQWLKNENPKLYADKLRATDYSDEIILASRDYINEGLKHERNDNIIEFARGNVNFKIGANFYSADVVVGFTSSQDMLLYDIVNIETVKEKINHAVQSNISADYRNGTIDSNNIIQEQKQNVNIKTETKGNYSANPDNDIESLRAENWRLRQNIEWLKRGEANEVLEQDVKYEAGELIKAYGSNVAKNDIAEQMQRLGNYIVQNGENVQWDEVKERATKIAKKVIDGVEVLINDQQMEEFAEIRKYLRKGFTKDGINKIKIADEYRNDVDPDFESWRKRHMGQFVISKDGTPIDSLWMDMQETFGTQWFPEDITHPADQLRHIGELFDETTAIYENPWSYDMAVAVESCANDILDRLSRNVRTERYTEEEHVEHAKEWLAGQEYKRDAERATKAIERLKEKQKKEIDKVWEKYKEKNENRALRGFRDSILKHVSRMSTKLLHATDKNHVPDALKEPALKIVSAINLDSDYVYEYNPHNNTYKLVKTNAAKGETKPTNRSIEFEKVRKQLIAMKDSLVIDPDLLSDGEVSGLIDDVIALGDKPLGKMNREELETVWKAIRGIEMAISSYNKTFSESRWASVEDAATAFVDDNSSKKAPKVLKHGQKFRDLQKLDMLTPETYFHEMGNAGDDIFRMMRDAQDKETTLLSEAVDFTNGIIGKMKINKIAEKQHTVTLGGEEVKLTTAQLIELYVLSNREQAKEHIYVGGILPTDLKGKGNKMIHHTTPIRGITAQEVKAAVSILSAEEVQLADKMQKFLSEDVAKWGNEASMKVYGYKKFGDKDYWPIKSNSQELKKSTEKETQVTSVANKGMTKAVVPNANNSVILGSAFDTFANHVVEMANYSAWLATMEDVNRIRNYKFSTIMDGDIGTVSQVIEKVHGNKGGAYLSKLLADIANGPAKMDSGNPFGQLVGKMKAASVGGNLRVIIQQPTAILRALDMIDPQYFVAGINVGKAWEKAKKYAPIAKWKDWGYFDIHTGRQLQNVMFNTDTALEKTQNLFMWGASVADSVSWGRIWAACEAETRHKHKELAKGSEEFYKAVAKRFTEVIDHTQVVDGILQRSQIMRNPDNLAKMATSFMGEPTKQYNMLLSAAYDATHKKGAQSKVKFARTAAALTLGAVVNAAAQSIVDAMRDDDKEERYREKWLDNFFGFTGEEEKLMDYVKAALNGNLPSAFNPLGYVPYYKDITSLIQGYDVTRMDMDSIESVLTAAQNMTKALEGNGKYNIAGASANLFLEMSRLLGIPVANLKRDVKSAVMTYAIESDNYLLQYRMEKALLNVNYSSNSGTFMGILYNAYTKDKEAYKIIYADLVKDGYDIEKIKTAMENRMKADQGVTKLNELDRRWLNPTQEAEYNELKDDFGDGKAADDYAYAKAYDEFEDESGMYYDALYDAMGEDFEDYKLIYDDIYDIVYEQELEKVKADEEIDEKDWETEAAKNTETAIGKAMESRMKDDAGIKSVKDLEQRWISPYEQEAYEKELSKLGGKSNTYIDEYARAKVSGDKAEQNKIITEAYAKDKKAYQTIYKDMIKSGRTEKEIRNTIEDKWQKEQGVDSVDDLKSRWLSPDEEKTYNKVSAEVKSSKIWREASSKYKEKTLERLYDLAAKTDTANSAGSEMQAKIDGGKKYGLTESEYMLFLMARDMVDKPSEKSGKLGNYTNDEVEAAIRMLKLSREENSYLWRAAGKNPNSDPWK